MGSQATTGLADVDWQVENLRLSIFGPMPPRQRGYWERLMGISPVSIDDRPREDILREQGPVGTNTLILASQLGRIDWQLLPTPTTAPQPLPQSAPRFVQAVDEAVDVLRRALQSSLSQIKQVDRLAFRAALANEAHTSEQTLLHLSRYLPQMSLVERGGLDFQYRINRRRRSRTAPHVSINRVTRWEVAQVQTGELRIDNRGVQFETHAVGHIDKVDIDVNTAPENNAIATDRMPALLNELIELVVKIADEGDIE
jgi:hypothetical protein